MSEDDFLERLRQHSQPLRYQLDDAALTRIRVRIQERLDKPTVSELLARWFRPLAAALAAVSVAAAIGIASLNRSDQASFTSNTVEITVAGETYSVSD